MASEPPTTPLVINPQIPGSFEIPQQLIKLGVTGPISTAYPLQSGVKLTESLEAVLKSFNLYEVKEGAQKREEVLGKTQCYYR